MPRLSVHVFTAWGVPVYFHATLPIGLAVVSGFSVRPLAWLALVIIVLIHEAGHAVLMRRFRLPVLRVVVHGFGGECETGDWINSWQRAVVAWGGVLAQGVLLFVVTSLARLGLWPRADRSDLYETLTAVNFLIAVFNLLPFGNLDGRNAWRLPWLVILRVKHAWLNRRLARLQEFEARAKRERLH